MTDPIVLPGKTPLIALQPGQKISGTAPAGQRVTGGTSRTRLTASMTASGTWVEPTPDPVPVPIPPLPTPTPSVIVPVGFAYQALAGLNLRPLPVTNGNDSGPGSYREAIANMSGRRVTFDYEGPIRLQSTVGANSPRHFAIDARGKSVTTYGYGTDLSNAIDGAVYNLASRGLVQVPFNSGLTFRNASSMLYVEGFSSDDYYHRALDIWHDSTDITVAWSILGHAGPQGYNYPLLAGDGAQRISLYRVLLIDGDTRMPQGHWRDNETAPDITIDMTGCIAYSARPPSAPDSKGVNRGYYSLVTAHGGAKINARGNILYSKFNQTQNRALHTEGGAHIFAEGNVGWGGIDLTCDPSGRAAAAFPVANEFMLPRADEATVLAQIIALAGRQPRDLADASYIAMLATH